MIDPRRNRRPVARAIARPHDGQRRLTIAVMMLVALIAFIAAFARGARAQDTRVRDLTVEDQTVPVRLMGYGLVVGLDGSGDRAIGGRSSGQTVASVVNLLKRFDVEVPAEMLRMRNVAAVLVTAEISPYLRSGGRFTVNVSSLGDARSLRGGVLYMTPMVAEVGGEPVAAAQGAMTVSVDDANNRRVVETNGRIADGGVLEADLPRPAFARTARLILRDPDLGTATRIADAINRALGSGTASVEDPGAVALSPKDSGSRMATLARIRDLTVKRDAPTRIVIDARDGTVVAGGDIGVGAATVSHGSVTLAIGLAADPATKGDPAGGDLRLPAGTPVTRVAAALHAVQAPPAEIAAIFQALRSAGAITAEIVVQ